jgi:hypothetical protein
VTRPRINHVVTWFQSHIRDVEERSMLRTSVLCCAVASVLALAVGCNLFTSDTPEAKRDAAVKTLKEDLDKLDKKVADLKDRAEKATGEAKAALEAKWKEAQAKRDAAAKKLEEVKAAAIDKWEAVKKDADKSFEEFKKSVE